jgi:TATA-binding protein-associated factor
MPFVLRRTKQQVLKDLPPKIITDIHCALTPLQKQLYEDFAATPVAATAAGALRSAAAVGGEDGGGSGGNGGGGGGGGAATHVFQALAYLRKLCSHPLLVLDWEVAEHRAAAAAHLGARTLVDARAQLAQAEAAPKLLALRDLLVQCGLVDGAVMGDGGGGSGGGVAGEADGGGAGGVDDGGHRVLVFAQLKATLDFVEQQLLTPLGVSLVSALESAVLVEVFSPNPCSNPSVCISDQAPVYLI